MEISFFPFLLLHVLALFYLPTPTMAAASINVLTVGAKPDGRTDSTKAFQAAWTGACQSAMPVTIYVPKGRYLLQPIVFQGPCKNNGIRFWIAGTLIAPANYGQSSRTWIDFNRVNGLTILGGTIDGQGEALWSCKLAGRSCPVGPPSLTIGVSSNVKVIGLTSINSKFFHIFIYNSQGVTVQGGKLIAPDSSPNTDGIHVQMSSGVTVLGTNIMTGDDCVSIGPGTVNAWIEGVFCGPGHGISIGSLANDYQEAGVQNVTVKRTTFTGTQNGFRIKTWGKPSTGFVRKIVFDGATMRNVQNPITIDQAYCPRYSGCPNKNSGIKISNVIYRGITGTSATEVAVELNCSGSNPCSGIILQNVKLTYQTKPALSTCKNVAGKAYGSNILQSCL